MFHTFDCWIFPYRSQHVSYNLIVGSIPRYQQVSYNLIVGYFTTDANNINVYSFRFEPEAAFKCVSMFVVFGTTPRLHPHCINVRKFRHDREAAHTFVLFDVGSYRYDPKAALLFVQCLQLAARPRGYTQICINVPSFRFNPEAARRFTSMFTVFGMTPRPHLIGITACSFRCTPRLFNLTAQAQDLDIRPG